ncbi:MAG TPA: Na+/H+ antiporter subunit E [Rubrobacter sp.]|nr:Na+/H+ antiporter subunit E [Rubrobacter sp.]
MLRDQLGVGTLLRRAAPRVVLLALLWWVLTGGETDSWLVGSFTIAGALIVSLALLPAGGWRWTLTGVGRFVPFFLWQSLVGGLDVALRALRPARPLDPAFLEYPLGLPSDPARVFMANTVSLLPGTLSAELEGQRLRVHTLTENPKVLENLRELESRVAGLFGLELEAVRGSES